MLEPGTQVAGYRIEGVLGHGGMGIVYSARQVTLERLVALKILAPQLSADESFRQRFRREGCRHHVANFLDAGQDGAECHEPRLREIGNDPGQGGLAGPGRSPQNDRLQEVAFDGLSERLTRRENLVLPDEGI